MDDVELIAEVAEKVMGWKPLPDLKLRVIGETYFYHDKDGTFIKTNGVPNWWDDDEWDPITDANHRDEVLACFPYHERKAGWEVFYNGEYRVIIYGPETDKENARFGWRSWVAQDKSFGRAVCHAALQAVGAAVEVSNE